MLFQVTVHAWGWGQVGQPLDLFQVLLGVAGSLLCFCASCCPRSAAGQVSSHIHVLSTYMPSAKARCILGPGDKWEAVSTPEGSPAVASWESGQETWWHCSLAYHIALTPLL